METNPYSVLEVSSRSSPSAPSASLNVAGSGNQTPKKKHRAGRKHKRSRRKSFAIPPEEFAAESNATDGIKRGAFYARGGNLSNASIDSEALLDHRDAQYPRLRRPSLLATSYSVPQPSVPRARTTSSKPSEWDIGDTENTPLLASPARHVPGSPHSYGLREGHLRRDRSGSRPASGGSSTKPRALLTPGGRNNVNYPPSMPGSPHVRPADRTDMNFGDFMMRDSLSLHRSPSNSVADAEIDPLQTSSFERRHTIAIQASDDVCFPQEGMSEVADDDLQQAQDKASMRSRRRRRNKWPDLAILEEWSRFEQDDKSEVKRMKKITEPQLVNGRLRPADHKGWFQIEEDAPYRFTYFNEELQSTIHSQTISELVQPDGSFRELFVPDPPLLSDSSSEDEDELLVEVASPGRGSEQPLHVPRRQPSIATTILSEPQFDANFPPKEKPNHSVSPQRNGSDEPTPQRIKSPLPSMMKTPTPDSGKKPRYGERPVWWLDVLSPTDGEMKTLAKAFGIHPLTSEDIMLQEQREKVELFRHYYFVNYRSFDQDATSENHLDPVNMYVVVFREGVLSFHFSQTPHPANVRRRIRQLKDFMMFSSDWISYAIIDDITDVYLPLIRNIEDEVDQIDDKILELHSSTDPDSSSIKQRRDSLQEKAGSSDENVEASGGDMLRRVGDCRKKVMTLYRLLGNKADVIKGFAKRCNEHWDVAPRSDIGLYLGDIQDHIVTMTANLSHYEMILARCHANYIAQINIRMNERAEQTADVLGKLTVLGTIVLPMNIITGLWGMNVWVPGQDYEGDLTWFFAITAGLLVFGLTCFWIAKRVYNIV
ncbi:hypothetical protein F4777DRAFT_536373 [Nemania sp. FL0916]|nr:hypothetical protein F4777DRAFT_536373 [Nemania sp. FL0916]